MIGLYTEGRPISGQVGLGYVGIQAEQAMVSKSINSVLSGLGSISCLLVPVLSSYPGFPPLYDNEAGGHFLPRVVFGHCFITATEKQIRAQGLFLAWNLPSGPHG